MYNNAVNIAVFDLDGTLWKVNSHYELLNLYYKTTFWTSFFYKVINKISQKYADYVRDKYFKKIPESFIDNVNFEFDRKIVSMLENKRNQGYEIVIISNAPKEIIVKNAATRLNCKYICAKAGEKFNALIHNYSYNELFVCTDNTTDIDLLKRATQYCIITTKRSRRFFIKRGFNVE